MKKGLLSIALAAALVAGVFSAIPAQAATQIPDVVQIDDPVGDANFVNDQDNAYGTPAAGQGDHVGPADASTATDLMKVWFSNTAADVSLHFQTEAALNNLAADFYFRFSSNAGEGPVANDTTRGCLQYTVALNGQAGGWEAEDSAQLVDKCNSGEVVDGTFLIEELDDGTGLTTLTFPRSASPLFADGGAITAPFGVARYLVVGPSPTTATAVTSDTTQRGTDYTIMAGGDTPPPVDEPPVVEEPEEPKKLTKADCRKMKNKKKRKRCLKKVKQQNQAPTDACAAYVPGEQGADAELLTVTDENTEEAPLEVTIEQEAGMANDQGLGEFATGSALYDGTAHTFRNVQVDTGGAENGLYIRYEFATDEDHDFYVNYANGSEAAHVGGFNPAPVNAVVFNFDGTGAGGHSEEGAEQLDGLRTADCAGYTVDFVNFLGAGGEYTVKMWLGETQNDPAAPAEDGGAAIALELMQGTLS